MAIGTGTAAKAAFKQKNHTSELWLTPAIDVNTPPNTGLYILSDTMPVGVPEYVQDESLGSAWESTGDSGNLDVTGDLNADLRYDGPFLNLIAMVMGAAAAPVAVTAPAYNHVLTLTDTTDGLYGTYCVYDGVTVREVPSLKVNGFELTSEAGQPVKLRLMVTGSDRIVTGQVNANLNAVTYVPVQPRAMFDDIIIRINNQSGPALASSDTFYASAWTLRFERPMVYAHVTNMNPGVTEGVADGKPTVALSLTEDRYTDVSRIVECRTKVPKKVDITLTGPIAAGAYPYKLFFEMPQLLYEDVADPINGAGKVIQDVTMRGQRAAAAPAGQPGLVLPLRLTATNLTSTVLLI